MGEMKWYVLRTAGTKEKKAADTYVLAESDWMNINVGDQIYITEKRTGADPYLSDKDGNKIADLIRLR